VPSARPTPDQPPDPRPARRFGVVAFVRHRASADRAILLAVFLVLLTTTTVAAATVGYADAAARTSLTRRLEAAGPVRTGLAVVATAPVGEAAATGAGLRDDLAGTLPGVDLDVRQVTRTTGSFALPGRSSLGGRPDLTVIAAVDDLETRAELVAGTWPAPGDATLQTVLSEPAAATLGLGVGDRLTVTSRVESSRSVDVLVVGIIRLVDADPTHWTGAELLVTGRQQGESFLTLGPLIVDSADLAASGEPRVEIATVVLPAIAAVTPAHVAPWRSRLAGLPARLEDRLGRARAATVQTELPALLASAAGSLLVGGTAILVLDLQLAIIAGYAVVLVAALMREWRAGETALLQARGAGRARLLRFTVVEALAMVGGAVVVGPILAWLGLGLVGAGGPAIPATSAGSLVGVVAVVGLAGLVGLLLPGVVAGAPVASVRRAIARPTHAPGAQRAGLDLAVLVIAGLALWQLRAYGGPLTTTVRGSIGVDPLLVIAPAIGLLAGVLLCLRLIPLLADRLAPLLDRRAGVTGWIGSQQLARRPLRYTAPALLLVVATGIGGFSMAYAATWQGSQADQVGHALGGATTVTIESADPPPTWAQGVAIAGATAGARATPVRREAFDLGGRLGRGELVAVDASALTGVVRLRDDLAERSPAALADALAAARPGADLPVLPGTPRALALDVVLDLAAARSDGSPIDLPVAWRGARAVVVVRDATGRLARLEGPTVALGDGRVRLVADLRDAAAGGATPAPPLELVSVGVGLRMPPSLTVAGEVAIRSVAVADDPAATREAWTAVALPASDGGWLAVRTDADRDPRLTPTADGDGARLVIPADDPLDETFGAVIALRAPVLDPETPPAIPALVDARLLTTLGARVGDRLQVGDRFDDPWSLEVVDVIDLVPSTASDRPAILADLAGFELAELALRDRVAVAGEWWIDSLAPEAAAAVEAALPGATVVRADDEVASRLDDPVVRSLTGALVATTLAASLFAIIGLTVSFAAAARDRRHEFAVLTALGLTGRQRDRGLAIEAAFVVGSGILAGLVVAAVLAWVVLPSVALRVDPGPVVPPARIAWPVWLLVPVTLAALGLWAMLVLAARAQLRGAGVAATIRDSES
jgi:hypothetical protein